VGYARGIAAPLTRRRISCKFLDLREIGKIPIRSVAYYITAGKSTSINGLECFVLHLKSIMAAGEIEASNLHETFPDLLL